MKRKKLMMLGAAGLASISTLAYSGSCFAASEADYTKDENVYVRMDNEGEVVGTYVVNSFTVTDAGEITDYGDYESIKNLTNLDEIEKDKNEYTFYCEKGKFYYQGNIKNVELPWNVDIDYKLDGKNIDAEDLAGEDGDLEITIRIMKNDNIFAASFFDAYMLQTSVTLDNKLCEDIEAAGATIVDTGANDKLTFSYIPGQSPVVASSDTEDKEEEKTEDGETKETKSENENVVAKYVITTTVEDFEMEDISFNGAPMVAVPQSFTSEDNLNTRQTMFIMSAEGIEIPEEEEVVEEVVEEGNFIEQIINRFMERNV